MTVDIDVCYGRDQANLERLAAALAPFHPRLRRAPPDLPFLWDKATLASGLNFTLTTDLGDIDILGEIPGLGSYAEVAAASSLLTVGKLSIVVLDLDGLERAKRAAGRAKDLMDLAEIAESRRRLGRDRPDAARRGRVPPIGAVDCDASDRRSPGGSPWKALLQPRFEPCSRTSSAR